MYQEKYQEKSYKDAQCATAKQAEIALQLDGLDKAHAELAEMVNILHDRLQPVLNATPTSEAKGDGNPERSRSDVALAFLSSAETICGDAIDVPLPASPSNPTKVLVVCGSLADAIGRLIGGEFGLPSQTLIDDLTDAEAAIVAAG